MDIGIVGAGVMGSEIAFAAAAVDTNVVLCNADSEALTCGVDHVVALAGRAARKGRITDDDAAIIVARVQPSTDIGDLHDCDLVIDTVSEVMATRRVVFGAIIPSTRPACRSPSWPRQQTGRRRSLGSIPSLRRA